MLWIDHEAGHFVFRQQGTQRFVLGNELLGYAAILGGAGPLQVILIPVEARHGANA